MPLMLSCRWRYHATFTTRYHDNITRYAVVDMPLFKMAIRREREQFATLQMRQDGFHVIFLRRYADAAIFRCRAVVDITPDIMRDIDVTLMMLSARC